MTVNAINGSLLSAVSAVDGIARSTLSAINGQTLAPTGLPALNLVFIDGSEHWATGVDKFKQSTFSSHSAPASGVTGAHGKVTDDATWDSHGVGITGIGTPSVKGRFRIRTLGNEELILLQNGTTTHLQLELRSDGALQVRSSAFTHITSSTYAIDTWYEMELFAVIDDSAGAYRLKVDGAIPSKSGGGTMDQSGLDTRNGATSTINQVKWGGGTTIDTYVDDHAIDASGNEIGLGQVETLYPNGAGDLAEMTRGGADSGANWSQCDEATLNGDTDYVGNTVSGKRDCYAFQNRSITGTPRAVQVTTTVKLTSGTPTFKNFLRIGGVNYDGSTTHTATSAYKCYVEVWNTNPATGLAWTDSDIDGLQAGISAIDANLRMTQVVVEVWVTT